MNKSKVCICLFLLAKDHKIITRVTDWLALINVAMDKADDNAKVRFDLLKLGLFHKLQLDSN